MVTIRTENASTQKARNRQSRKPYYSGYAEHMLNYYLRRKQYAENCPGMIDLNAFPTEIDRLNWEACDRVYATLNQNERAVLGLVHCTQYDETPERIRRYALSTGQAIIDIWRTEHHVQYLVAVERGLVAKKEEEPCQN